MLFGHGCAGLWPLELLAQASNNATGDWRGIGLPSDAERIRASAFVYPYTRPNIHGGRSSVAYSTVTLSAHAQTRVNKPT